ncbi:hypothetical protein [Wielerella bovis]|uniref:hypothetical protein n=1 Tax=Wielerella bovis TaxID=2917790 RepID=UPI0020185AFB|nr:hypothetical protein [Wielerella bovis]MCG7655912.1 hypothetical protein [Wielerella bovis]MCG7656890.1 hypothetical protein [Wielerella bovis]MCG7658101.1 hypothetical protein [Wielerella bovis]MCG7658171.1 hypothetical protein [Wielerella bovis]MCG7659113.1 hypothetical protein [Wielerella bovis]
MTKPFIYAQTSLVIAIISELARQNPQGTLSDNQGNVVIQAANQIIAVLNAGTEKSND